jgi:hypothetical protein
MKNLVLLKLINKKKEKKINLLKLFTNFIVFCFFKDLKLIKNGSEISIS